MNIDRWSSQEKMAKTGVAEILRNSGIPEKFGMKRQFELFKILIFSFYRKNLDIKIENYNKQGMVYLIICIL